MATSPATPRDSVTADGPATPLAPRSGWRAYRPAVAGVAYVAAWLAGLAAWQVNLALNATAEQVAASYRATPGQAVTQYLLTEGLAGVLLGAVYAAALLDTRRRTGRGVAGPAVLGAIAVTISLAQCAIGIVITVAAASHDTALCGTLSDLVNRLDGGKMLALAGAAGWLAVIGRDFPRWLRAVAIPLGLALIASGYAYLALSQALAWTAYISGPLLLLWIAGTGIALTISRRNVSPTAW